MEPLSRAGDDRIAQPSGAALDDFVMICGESFVRHIHRDSGRIVGPAHRVRTGGPHVRRGQGGAGAEPARGGGDARARGEGGRRPTARLADSSLEAACGTLAPGEAPAVRSDRGGHCRWPRRIATCEASGLARGMSRKGMSCDNARAEGLFGLLEQEFPYSGTGRASGSRGSWPSAWMRWLRSGRISEALGWLTPDEHRLAPGYAV